MQYDEYKFHFVGFFISNGPFYIRKPYISSTVRVRPGEFNNVVLLTFRLDNVLIIGKLTSQLFPKEKGGVDKMRDISN